MADIFISYARADRDRIEKLAAALETEGYSVWWDRHIAGGAEYSKDIEAALNASKAVIVAWSESAIESTWVKDEAVTAREQGKLIPVTLDGSPAPMGFKQFHLIDFEDWDGKTEAASFQDISRTIKARLTGETPAPAAAPARKRKKSAGVHPSVYIVGIVALAIVAIVIFGGDSGSDWVGESEESAANAENIAAATPADNDRPANETQADPASIAVLPFADLSPEGDQEYFSDGISEEILNVLVRVDGLDVASRTSAFRFKGETKSIPVIASELGVAHVLEGSVRKAGDRIRITAQLIEAGSDVHLWSETYDRELTVENIFEIQDEIAKEIVTALQGELAVGGVPQTLVEKSAPSNLDAYELYLQAKALVDKGQSLATIEPALALLEQAIALEPDFTDALLEYAYWLQGLPSWSEQYDREEYLDKAWGLNERALALAPDHPNVARNRASILAGRFEWAKANEEAKRAIALAPNNSEMHFNYGFILAAQGYASEAIPALQRAVELDPEFALHRNFLGLALAADGQFEEAKHMLIEAYRYGYGGWMEGALSELYLRTGDIDSYRFTHANLYRNRPAYLPPLSRYVVDARLAPEEDREAAVANFWRVTGELGFIRDQLLAVLEDGALHPIDIAQLSNGDAFARPFPKAYYPWFWGPAYDGLRGKEGFREMLRIAKLPEHWRAHGWPDKCKPLGDNDFECN